MAVDYFHRLLVPGKPADGRAFRDAPATPSSVSCYDESDSRNARPDDEVDLL